MYNCQCTLKNNQTQIESMIEKLLKILINKTFKRVKCMSINTIYFLSD